MHEVYFKTYGLTVLRKSAILRIHPGEDRLLLRRARKPKIHGRRKSHPITDPETSVYYAWSILLDV
jgi:hypothetical protein